MERIVKKWVRQRNTLPNIQGSVVGQSGISNGGSAKTTVSGCKHPAISNLREEPPPTLDSSFVGSSVLKMQSPSLMSSGEGPMRVRLKVSSGG